LCSKIVSTFLLKVLQPNLFGPANSIEIATFGLYYTHDDRQATALTGAVEVACMEDSAFISHDVFGPEIAGVLIPRARIAARVEELASSIAASYPDGDLTILAVLTGAVVFMADLIRSLPMRVRLDAVRVNSYPGQATRSHGPEIIVGPVGDFQGRHVLIVDDILDSGQTIELLHERVLSASPASVRTCVLLSKRRDDLPGRVAAEFVGFDIKDDFVVGYGLDYGDLYRNLPDICLLRCLAGRDG